MLDRMSDFSKDEKYDLIELYVLVFTIIVYYITFMCYFYYTFLHTPSSNDVNLHGE